MKHSTKEKTILTQIFYTKTYLLLLSTLRISHRQFCWKIGELRSSTVFLPDHVFVVVNLPYHICRIFFSKNFMV